MGQPSDVHQRNYSFFHSNAKTLTENTQNVYESQYRSGHVSFLRDILANPVDHCPTPTDADNFAEQNPNIVRKYTQIQLTEVTGSNGQTWCIMDASAWMKPILTESVVFDPITNEPSYGFSYRLYTESYDPIPPTNGVWWVDVFQGIVKFEPGYTPYEMGWGQPRITCYVYVGETLEQYLSKVKSRTFKYKSSSPTIRHDIYHDLNSIDLDVNVLVQDPLDESWNNDSVNVKYLNTNAVRVELTESCNVNVNISCIED